MEAATTSDPMLERLEDRQQQLERRVESLEAILLEIKAFLIPSSSSSSAKQNHPSKGMQAQQEEEVCVLSSQGSDHSSLEEAPTPPLVLHSPALSSLPTHSPRSDSLQPASSGMLMHIPFYRGELDGELLWNWLDRVEDYFKHGQASEDEKVLIATYHLKDAAYHWWKKMSHQSDELMDWSNFKIALLKRFMPESYLRDAKFSLMDLKQCGSVSEYNRDFSRLASRLPTLHQEDRLAFYVHGLKSSVRSEIDHHSPQSLQQAMRIAELCCESSSCW